MNHSCQSNSDLNGKKDSKYRHENSSKSKPRKKSQQGGQERGYTKYDQLCHRDN